MSSCCYRKAWISEGWSAGHKESQVCRQPILTEKNIWVKWHLLSPRAFVLLKLSAGLKDILSFPPKRHENVNFQTITVMISFIIFIDHFPLHVSSPMCKKTFGYIFSSTVLQNSIIFVVSL